MVKCNEYFTFQFSVRHKILDLFFNIFPFSNLKISVDSHNHCYLIGPQNLVEDNRRFVQTALSEFTSYNCNGTSDVANKCYPDFSSNPHLQISSNSFKSFTNIGSTCFKIFSQV